MDIFAFAMVIYEILSGRRPFGECENLAQISKAMKIQGKRPDLKVRYVAVMLKKNVYSVRMGSF